MTLATLTWPASSPGMPNTRGWRRPGLAQVKMKVNRSKAPKSQTRGISNGHLSPSGKRMLPRTRLLTTSLGSTASKNCPVSGRSPLFPGLWALTPPHLRAQPTWSRAGEAQRVPSAGPLPSGETQTVPSGAELARKGPRGEGVAQDVGSRTDARAAGLNPPGGARLVLGCRLWPELEVTLFGGQSCSASLRSTSTRQSACFDSPPRDAAA